MAAFHCIQKTGRHYDFMGTIALDNPKKTKFNPNCF